MLMKNNNKHIVSEERLANIGGRLEAPPQKFEDGYQWKPL